MAVCDKQLLDLEEKQRSIDRAPFRNLRIDDPSILDSVQGREICESCHKSRKFFCYTCCKPVIERNYFPRIKLPIKIDIIKHAREIDGKSTAIHAAILAPEDVKIYTYPEFPIFSKNERIVLIFPSQTARTVDDLFTPEYKKSVASTYSSEKQFPIDRAVFVDSTWHQTKSIYKDQRLRDLPCVILKSRISQFWRHQKKSPRWYLATIEAIHELLVELHQTAYGTAEDYAQKEISHNDENSDTSNLYRGQYDNLLFFFKYMYEKIHTIYDHEKLWAYKRPLI